MVPYHRRRRPPPPARSIISPNFVIPIDLIIEILSFLSVKTLHRFNSVCKTWCALIKSPDFINKHLIRSKSMNFTSLLVSDWKIKSTWLHYIDQTENHNPRRNYSFYSEIVSICDGLVCTILGNNFDSFIFNPSTGLIRKTSRSSLPKTISYIMCFGFAFRDNDYKLFRIVYFTSDDEFVVRAEVYSMRTNIWNEIKVKKQVFDTRLYIKGYLSSSYSYILPLPVTKNEVFYWSVYCSNVPSLVSFDMNGYVFDMILCPEELIRDDKLNWQLIDLKGEIALTSCRYNKCFDVWVLNEKEKSWTMKLRTKDLPLLDWSLRSLGFDRNDDNLVMQHASPDFGRELFSYNMESHEIIYLPFVGIKQWQPVYLYKESLLSV